MRQMGYNVALKLWLKEEMPMCLTEKKTMGMQEVIFIEKCIAIVMIMIACVLCFLGKIFIENRYEE